MRAFSILKCIVLCIAFGVLGILSQPYTAFAQKKDKAGKASGSFTSEVGLQLYSLRAEFPKDVEGTLAKIQQMGIREIEGGGFYGMEPEAFKKLTEKYGLVCPSIGAGYDRFDKDMEGIIRDAKTMGANYVMVAWIPHKGDDFTIEDAKKAASDFNRWGEKLKASGINFCYHIHGYEFRPYEKGTLFDYIVKNTNPQFVNFEMDVFWTFHGGADPLYLLKKYPNRFSLMHLKDMKKGEKGNNTGHAPDEWNVPLGTGQIAFKPLLLEAQRLGVKHYFIEDEHPDALHQIPQSLQYLKSLNTSSASTK
jgi:sugar phosphate isomerase/epimerase